MPVADAEYETSSTPSQPGRSTELLPQHICIGLRSDAVSFDACETFQVLCRVVDSTFSHVSAEVLFELRAAAPDARAVRAFDSLVGPEAARLFEQGVGLQVGQVGGAQYDDFADLAIADITLAKALVAETKKIDSRLGGLYQGRLDHLRSTLCNPALGVNASGCCAACCAIRKDRSFVKRLRISLVAGRTSAGACAPSKANKRALSIDEDPQLRSAFSSRAL